MFVSTVSHDESLDLCFVSIASIEIPFPGVTMHSYGQAIVIVVADKTLSSISENQWYVQTICSFVDLHTFKMLLDRSSHNFTRGRWIVGRGTVA